MLESISQAGHFTCLQAGPPASEKNIQKFVDAFGDGYEDYVSLVREATEIEFLASNGRYARVHEPASCIETYEAYQIEDYVPDAVPIGDDGSGGCIYYGNGANGKGLYLMDYGNKRQPDARWLARSLTDFLVNGEGADQLG